MGLKTSKQTTITIILPKDILVIIWKFIGIYNFHFDSLFDGNGVLSYLRENYSNAKSIIMLQRGYSTENATYFLMDQHIWSEGMTDSYKLPQTMSLEILGQNSSRGGTFCANVKTKFDLDLKDYQLKLTCLTISCFYQPENYFRNQNGYYIEASNDNFITSDKLYFHDQCQVHHSNSLSWISTKKEDYKAIVSHTKEPEISSNYYRYFRILPHSCRWILISGIEMYGSLQKLH